MSSLCLAGRQTWKHGKASSRLGVACAVDAWLELSMWRLQRREHPRAGRGERAMLPELDMSAKGTRAGAAMPAQVCMPLKMVQW